MGEVKKSYFLALETESGADLIAAGTATPATFNSVLPDVATSDARTAFLLEPSGLPDLALDYEETTRDVIRNSYLPAAPLRGIINTSSSMTFELHGAGYGMEGANAVVRKPDFHPFLNSAFGNFFRSAEATHSGVITLGTVYTNLKVGATTTVAFADTNAGADITLGAEEFMLLRNAGGGLLLLEGDGTINLKVLAKIGTFTNNNYTKLVNRTYFMPSTLGDIPQFAIAMYRGNIVRELYSNIGVTSVEIPLKAGEIVLPNFSFNVAGGAIDSEDYETDALFTAVDTVPSSNSYPPEFAKSVDWEFYVYDGSEPVKASQTFTDLGKIVDAVSFKLNNEQVARKSIEAVDGIFDYRISSRTVDLTLSAYYDDPGDDFAKNLSSLFLTSSNRLAATAVIGDDGTDTGDAVNVVGTRGTRCLIVAPRFGFKTKVTEENGLFKYDVTGSAEKDEWFGENVFLVTFF